MVKPILLAQVMPSDLAFSSFSFSPLSGVSRGRRRRRVSLDPSYLFFRPNRPPTNQPPPSSLPHIAAIFLSPPSFLCPKRQSLLRRKWGGEMGGRAGMSRGNLGRKPQRTWMPTVSEEDQKGGKGHFCRPGKLFPAAFEIEKYATLHQKKAKPSVPKKSGFPSQKGG